MAKKTVAKKTRDTEVEAVLKVKKEVDPYSLDDIDGLGDASIKLLNKEGFFTSIQIVARSNPTELASICGKDRDEAGLIFARIKQKCIDAKLIGQPTMTASEVYEEQKNRQRIKTNCVAIDNLLGGGFECRHMYEIYGENGSGKTQTVHTLCVNVQLPIEEGGLSENGEPVFVYYIETEGTFRPERLLSILEGKKLITQRPAALAKKMLEMKPLTEEERQQLHDIEKQQRIEAEKYFAKIIIKKCRDPYEQLLAIKDVTQMIRERPEDKDKLPIRLIVVDSVIAPIRHQMLGRGNISAKKDILNDMLGQLFGIAETYNLPVILVNQIYNSPTEEYGADPDHSSGGHILHHRVGTRIKLEVVGAGKTRRMKIIKSSYQANNEVRFMITKAGLSDVEA